MKKILTAGIMILVGMGGCKSLDCGCPMAIDNSQKSSVRNQQTNLTPDTCLLAPSNSNESHHHYDQKTCTD